MRLQKIVLGILIALTCLTIFARGQEIWWDTEESLNTPLPSTGYTETTIYPFFEVGTGEVLGTGWWSGNFAVPTATSGQELTGEFLMSWVMISDITTGEDTQTWWVQTTIPNLIISEVFYDGTDEWIEITNLSTNLFSGIIQITWSISITSTISIKPRQSIILVKPSGNYLRIDLNVARITTSTFSLTDTKSINLTLSTSGQILDLFLVETGWVVKLDNKKTSFEKRIANEEGIITWTSAALNVLEPYIANPWYITRENWIETTTWSTIDNTGQLLSGSDSFLVDWPLKITEIGDKNWIFSPFIEIQAKEDWDAIFIITGSLLKEGFSLDKKLNKWDLLLIVKSDNWWLSTQNIIENTRLELQKSGFLSIYGQSGQVFDSIFVLSTYTGKSLYYWWKSNSTHRIFDVVDIFSPGFDEKFLLYFSGITADCTNVSVVSPSSGSFEEKPGLSTGVQIVEPGLLQIEGLVFKWDESITLSSLWTGIVDLSDHKRYLLTRATGKTEWGKTKKYLTGLLYSGQNTTISKTFGFLDGGGCVSLWYSGSLYDSYCYTTPIENTDKPIIKEVINIDGTIMIESVNAKTPESITLKSSLSTTVDLSDKNRYLRTRSSQVGERGTTKKYLQWFIAPGEDLRISKIFGFLDKGGCVSLRYVDKQYDSYCYTPETNNSTWVMFTGEATWSMIPKASIISLLPNPKGKDISETILILAQETYPFTWFFLKINTTKHKLLNPLFSWENILTGALGLINKSACVELWRNSSQLDIFCYGNPKENQWFGQTNEILESITQSDFSLLSKVKFEVSDNKICTQYLWQSLSCRSLPTSKTSIKLKNENKLYKTYTNLLQEYLRKNRSTLFYSTAIKEYFATLSQAKKAVDDFQETMVISGQQIDVQDLATQIALKTKTGYVESGNENSLPQRILWVQKLWRRSASLWHHRSNFFSVSRNWEAFCWGSRCYSDTILDRKKLSMIIEYRTNKQTFLHRKQQSKTNSSPPKHIGFWSI